MHTIKNFGNDHEFSDLDELWRCLVSDYCGKSVAVHVNTDSGIIRPVFVDVDSAGTVNESYGSRRVIRAAAELV